MPCRGIESKDRPCFYWVLAQVILGCLGNKCSASQVVIVKHTPCIAACSERDSLTQHNNMKLLHHISTISRTYRTDIDTQSLANFYHASVDNTNCTITIEVEGAATISLPHKQAVQRENHPPRTIPRTTLYTHHCIYTTPYRLQQGNPQYLLNHPLSEAALDRLLYRAQPTKDYSKDSTIVHQPMHIIIQIELPLYRSLHISLLLHKIATLPSVSADSKIPSLKFMARTEEQEKIGCLDNIARKLLVLAILGEVCGASTKCFITTHMVDVQSSCLTITRPDIGIYNLLQQHYKIGTKTQQTEKMHVLHTTVRTSSTSW